MVTRSFTIPTLLLALLMHGTTLLAQEIDVTLSNDSAQIRYITHSNGGFGNSEIDMGLLYSDSNDVLGMLGLTVLDEAGSGSPGLKVGMGIKGFVANTDSFDVAALSVGGGLRYALPSTNNRLALRGQFFYSPGIVTFIDADRFLYATARVEYELLSQAVIYIGYRRVRVGLKDLPDVTLDNDTHIGMQFFF